MARNIDIVICYPPTLNSFKQNNLPCVKAIEDLCHRYQTPCLIDYNNKFFQNHPELFYDNGHVNMNGANKYSNDISYNLHNIIDI